MTALFAFTGASSGQSGQPTGWSGANPFACVLQQAGKDTVVPDPGADPYCVEFDKREQNVSELGLVDFLSKEPARVSAATPKCFYFQADHWRGSFVQSDGATKTYEWDGHYFFDKATGDGGAYVTNFNVNGQTADPRQVPGIPPEYSQHLGPGTGGVITRNAVDADPACVARAKAEPEKIYARNASAAGPSGGPRGCVTATGPATRRRLGPLTLGETDRRLRARFGDPARVHRGALRWCAAGGGELLAFLRTDRSGELAPATDERAVLLATTSRAVRVSGTARRRALRVGTSARAFRRAAPRRVRVGRFGRTRVYALSRRSRVLLGVGGRVRWVGVRGVTGRAALSRLRPAGL